MLLGNAIEDYTFSSQEEPFQIIGKLFELRSMDTNGSNLVKLAPRALYGAWSPNSQLVAYTVPTQARGLAADIYVVDTTTLVSQWVTGGDIRVVQWLPTGEITFLRNENIWAVQPDGTGERQLNPIDLTANDPVHNNMYVISPKGRKIAYYYEDENLNGYLWMANLDGSGAMEVATDYDLSAGIGGIQWSPNGAMLAFRVMEPSDHLSLGVVNADGSNNRRIRVEPFAILSSPSWSPDGNLLLFTGGSGGAAHEATLFLIGQDGRGLQILDPGLGQAWDPYWSPDGSKIVFYRQNPAELPAELDSPGQYFLIQLAWP